jgi:hypothetical protein
MTNKKEYIINHVSLTAVSMYHTNLVNGDGEPAGEMRNVGLTISWSGNIGFGEIHISDRGDRGIKIDAEQLSKEFVRAVLMKLVDNAELDEYPRCDSCKKCFSSLRSGGYYCPNCEPKEDDDPIDEDERALPRLIAAARDVLQSDDIVAKKQLRAAMKWYGVNND